MITQVDIKKINTKIFQKIFVLCLLLVSLVLYSQSFTVDNPDVYIGSGAIVYTNEQDNTCEVTQQSSAQTDQGSYEQEKGEVYIDNDAVVFGISKLENCEVYHHRSPKKDKYCPKSQKFRKTVKNITHPTCGGRIIIKICGIVNLSYRRGGCSAFVVTGPTSHVNKSKIYKENPCLSQMIFIYKDSVMFSYYSTPAVSGLKFFTYSRPPPQS